MVISGLGGPLQCGQPVSRPVSDRRAGFGGFSIRTIRCDLLSMESREGGLTLPGRVFSVVEPWPGRKASLKFGSQT